MQMGNNLLNGLSALAGIGGLVFSFFFLPGQGCRIAGSHRPFRRTRWTRYSKRFSWPRGRASSIKQILSR